MRPHIDVPVVAKIATPTSSPVTAAVKKLLFLSGAAFDEDWLTKMQDYNEDQGSHFFALAG